jgi:hypothetical protein
MSHLPAEELEVEMKLFLREQEPCLQACAEKRSQNKDFVPYVPVDSMRNTHLQLTRASSDMNSCRRLPEAMAIGGKRPMLEGSASHSHRENNGMILMKPPPTCA